MYLCKYSSTHICGEGVKYVITSLQSGACKVFCRSKMSFYLPVKTKLVCWGYSNFNRRLQWHFSKAISTCWIEMVFFCCCKNLVYLVKTKISQHRTYLFSWIIEHVLNCDWGEICIIWRIPFVEHKIKLNLIWNCLLTKSYALRFIPYYQIIEALIPKLTFAN